MTSLFGLTVFAQRKIERQPICGVTISPPVLCNFCGFWVKFRWGFSPPRWQPKKNLLTKDGIWRTLLRRNYIGSKVVSQIVWKHGDSHFWARLMTRKKHFSCFESFNIKYGSNIILWEDIWWENTTLREYNIVRHKNDTSPHKSRIVTGDEPGAWTCIHPGVLEVVNPPIMVTKLTYIQIH